MKTIQGKMMRYFQFVALAFAVMTFLSCYYPGPTYGLKVDLPVERAQVRELRFDQDGFFVKSYDLVSYSGTSDKPCLQVEANRVASAGAGYSALILSSATSAAVTDAYGGYSGYSLSFYSGIAYQLAGRCGQVAFAAGPSDYSALVAPFGEPRCLLLGRPDAISYSILGTGLVETARKANGALTGDARSYSRAVALPLGGYAAFAMDELLKSEVCSFLDDELTVQAKSWEFTTDSWPSIGASSTGIIYILSYLIEGSQFLQRIDRAVGVSKLPVNLPALYNMNQHSPSWAGDRFWLGGGTSFESVEAEDGTVKVFASPINLDLGYAFMGLPDGGLLVYGPLEPVRDGSAISPPYGPERLSVWRFDSGFNLSWKTEWIPELPARILAVAGDAEGVSVFLCVRN